jgi:S-adenosyl methyltransferase
VRAQTIAPGCRVVYIDNDPLRWHMLALYLPALREALPITCTLMCAIPTRSSRKLPGP